MTTIINGQGYDMEVRPERLQLCLHWRKFSVITPGTAIATATVYTMAIITLSQCILKHKRIFSMLKSPSLEQFLPGGMTKNKNDPICVALPKVAKASKDTCRCGWCYHQQMLPYWVTRINDQNEPRLSILNTILAIEQLI